MGTTCKVSIHRTLIDISVEHLRSVVSRPARGSWFRDDQHFEALLFQDGDVRLIDLNTETPGPRLDLCRRGPDGRLSNYFIEGEVRSAVWDSWTERVLFGCGTKVMCLHGDNNEVSVLADFASSTDPAPRSCDFLALDPQHHGRLWVVTYGSGYDGEKDSSDSDYESKENDDDSYGYYGAVYEVDLRLSASPSPSWQPAATSSTSAEGSSAPQWPLPVTRARLVATFTEPLRAAAFDAARRLLLVASRYKIYRLPVDRWRWPDGPAEQDDGECVEPEPMQLELVGSGTGDENINRDRLKMQRTDREGDGPLYDIVGLVCDGAGGSCYAVENFSVLLLEERSPSIRRLPSDIPTSDRTNIWKLELCAAGFPGQEAAGGSGSGGSGSEDDDSGDDSGGDSAELTLFAEARGHWRDPHIMPDGRLAMIGMCRYDRDEEEGVLLLNLYRPPPRVHSSDGNDGNGGAAAVGPSGGALPGTRCPHSSRSLAADLGALLDSCLGPGSGGGGDVTLVAAGGVELRAHGAILMARCGYFSPLLAEGGGFGDSGSRRVQLHDVDAGVLRCVLRHIYTGETDIESLVLEQQQQQPQREEGRQQQQPQRGPGAISDPLLALAEASDRLLLPDLCREAQRRVLERCAAAPAAHLVPDLLWAESRGSFGRLVTELKRMYVERAKGAPAAVAAHESRRLVESNPDLAAEMEMEVAARKRRRLT